MHQVSKNKNKTHIQNVQRTTTIHYNTHTHTHNLQCWNLGRSTCGRNVSTELCYKKGSGCTEIKIVCKNTEHFLWADLLLDNAHSNMTKIVINDMLASAKFQVWLLCYPHETVLGYLLTFVLVPGRTREAAWASILQILILLLLNTCISAPKKLHFTKILGIA